MFKNEYIKNYIKNYQAHMLVQAGLQVEISNKFDHSEVISVNLRYFLDNSIGDCKQRLA